VLYSLYSNVFISIFPRGQILIFPLERYIKLRGCITLLNMSAPVTTAPVPSPAVLDTMVKVIMSQTEMSHENVVSELERTNYDLKRVIRDYMRGDTNNDVGTINSPDTIASTNQLRFSEIRNFMDKSSEMYYRRQEMDKIYNEVLEKKKRMAEAEAAAAAGAASPETPAASGAAASPETPAASGAAATSRL